MGQLISIQKKEPEDINIQNKLQKGMQFVNKFARVYDDDDKLPLKNYLLVLFKTTTPVIYRGRIVLI